MTTRFPAAPGAPTAAVQHHADVAVPADTGCDWQRLDPRFVRCVSCPLPRCRYDYPAADQAAAAKLLPALLDHDPRPTHRRSRTAPPTRPHRQRAAAIAAALPAGEVARIAHQALVRGRSRL